MADDYDVTWFEEPVSSDDLAGLSQVRDAYDGDVAAGEYGYTLGYFAKMLQSEAVDCLQADVTQVRRIHRVAAGRRPGRRPPPTAVRALRP